MRGVYFALITFGMAQVIAKVVYNTRALGASDGMIGVPIINVNLGITSISSASPAGFFLVVLAVTMVLYAVAAYLLDTPFGRLLIAIKANDRRVPFLGYEATHAAPRRPMCWRRRSPRVSGALYPMLRGFVSPELLFFSTSGNAVITVITRRCRHAGRRALWRHPADGPEIRDRKLDRTPSHHHRPVVHGRGDLLPQGLMGVVRPRDCANGSRAEAKP